MDGRSDLVTLRQEVRQAEQAFDGGRDARVLKLAARKRPGPRRLDHRAFRDPWADQHCRHPEAESSEVERADAVFAAGGAIARAVAAHQPAQHQPDRKPQTQRSAVGAGRFVLLAAQVARRLIIRDALMWRDDVVI